MDKKKLKDLVTLADIIHYYGEAGGTLDEILKELEFRRGIEITPAVFHRYRTSIKEYFGFEVLCRKDGRESRYYLSPKDAGVKEGFNEETIFVNSFLLSNSVTDELFPKGRIYISPYFNNTTVHKIAHAILHRNNMKIVHRRLVKAYQKKEDGGVDFSKTKYYLQDREMEVTPLAMSFNGVWYAFCKNTRDNQLLVLCAQSIRSIKEVKSKPGDYLEDFDFQNVIEHPEKYLRYDMTKMNQDDDRLQFLDSHHFSHFK